jgi:hypothetical protein
VFVCAVKRPPSAAVGASVGAGVGIGIGVGVRIIPSSASLDRGMGAGRYLALGLESKVSRSRPFGDICNGHPYSIRAQLIRLIALSERPSAPAGTGAEEEEEVSPLHGGVGEEEEEEVWGVSWDTVPSLLSAPLCVLALQILSMSSFRTSPTSPLSRSFSLSPSCLMAGGGMQKGGGRGAFSKDSHFLRAVGCREMEEEEGEGEEGEIEVD